jgi:hypothetical protein
MRDVRHHRPEACSGARSDQHMGGGENGKVRRIAGENETEPERYGGEDQGQDDAGAVCHPPERDGRDGERAHHDRIGERGRRAVDAEVALRLRQDHDDRPHAHADQRRDQERQGEPGESVGPVGRVSAGRRGEGRKLVHGPNLRHTSGDSNSAMWVSWRGSLRSRALVYPLGLWSNPFCLWSIPGQKRLTLRRSDGEKRTIAASVGLGVRVLAAAGSTRSAARWG